MTEPPPSGPLRIDPDAIVLWPFALLPADFRSPLPVQNHHMVFADPTVGTAVGVWQTATMQERPGPCPHGKSITVLDGAFVTLGGQRGAAAESAGHGVTFRQAIPVNRTQDGNLRKVCLTLRDPGTGTPHIASAQGGMRAPDPDLARPDPVPAVRVPYMGQLGYDLYVPTEYSRAAPDALPDRVRAAGVEPVHCSLLAPESLLHGNEPILRDGRDAGCVRAGVLDPTPGAPVGLGVAIHPDGVTADMPRSHRRQIDVHDARARA